MDVKKVLTHLIRAGRDAIHLERLLNNIGYGETPYFQIHSEIAEAIYTMIGEQAESFDESITCTVMNDYCTSDEQCAKYLSSVMEAGYNVPEATMEVIRESAHESGMDTDKLIRLILSDWARKEVMFRQAFNT